MTKARTIENLRVVLQNSEGGFSEGLRTFDRFLSTWLPHFKEQVRNGAGPKDFDEYLGDYIKFIFFVDDLDVMDSHGGEGKGEEYWKVFRLGDKFYRYDGEYTSWEPVYLDENSLREVHPKVIQKTIYVDG